MNKNLKEKVYSPDSALCNKRELFREILIDLKNSRELAIRLLTRNIKSQYRQSYLGYLWAFIPPLFMTSIWVFLNSQKIFNVEGIGMPYPIFVLSGMVLWQTFVEALNSPLKMVSESKAMLVAVNFPREALIIAGIGEVIFNFLIRLLLLVPLYLWYEFPIPVTVLLVPIGIAFLIGLGVMIGLLFTPLGILYNDISRGILLTTQAWFFITPIIYSIPQNSILSKLILLNPVTPILITTREWMTIGNNSLLSEFIILSFFIAIFLIFGWLIFRLAIPHLISRMSA